MEVLLFTIFASVLLAAGFVAFFVYTQKNPDADADRDSLLPLEEEKRVSREITAKSISKQTELKK
jgi:hypothetical protein